MTKRRASADRKLRGPYAMFFLGHVHDPDEPYFVGHQPSDLLHAADGMWGVGWGYAGLWATARDRAHTLSEAHRLRAERAGSK